MKQKGKQKLKISPLKEALGACRVMFKYALLFGAIVNFLMLSTPIYSMQVLDRVISSSNLDTLLMLTLVIFLALGLLALIQSARTFAMIKMGAWLEEQLSLKLFSNSVKAALQTKSSAGSQQLRDLQTVKTYLTSPGLTTMLDVPWALIFIIVLFMIHLYMGTVAIIGGIILITIAIISDRMTKPLHDSSNEQFIQSMKQVEQATRNAEVIEVMGLLPNITKNWQALNQRVQGTQALAGSRQSVLSELTKFIRLVLQVSVTGLGAYLVLQGQISVGAIIACSALTGRALAPFEASIMSWKGFVNARKAYQRLEASLEQFTPDEDLMSLPAPEGKLEIENVYFAPPGSQKHVIKAMSFGLNAGETLVMIGPSASGKTTLAKLIVGAWHPQIGTVRLDNASLSDWRRDELGQHIGYLPQDIELFSGTIKENIARMDKEADHEKIIEAAQLAGVHDLILHLPNGYDTDIGSDGSILSGGQRQRIGLARAFFGDPKLLVLDEPNASLDSFGEIALSNALARAKEKKITTIVISHRTSILNAADKILAVKEGTPAMFGSKEEVMEQMNQAARQTAPMDISKKKGKK